LQKSGLDAMRQTIREVDPLRPSLCVGTLSAELRTAVARQRDTDPGKLSLLLRGDLDWIAMHCLEKDRARRYATAGDLAADVLRSLANEPIVARPPSSTYRLRKFVRRHRLGFIAGSAMAASVLAALVLSSVSLVRERAANRREAALRAEADANAAQARAAAERSAQTAQFMTAMLEGVGPSVALGRDTTMLREIVDRTARRLEVELRGQPEVSAGLRETLGVVYRDLGDYPTAEPLLREAAKTHRTIYGNESPQLAASLDLLGDVLRRLNQPEAAEQALQEALQIRRRLFGEQHPLFADTLFHLSLVRSPRRSPDEMESMVRQVLAIRRKNYPGEHPAIAEALSRLGTIARNKLEHEKAVELHTEAVAIQRKLLGNEHPAVADALDNLGFSLAHVGRRAESIAAYRETFFIRRKMLGDGHPQTAASLLFFLGQIPAAEAGEEIVSLVRDFIASQRQLLRPGAVALAPSLLALASLLDQPGRDPAAARAAVDEAMGLFAGARVRGPALDVDIIDAMALYGWWKFLSQVPAEGRTMSEEAITLAREAYGATSNGMVLPNHILAWLYLGMERKDEAVGQFEEAVRVDHAVLGPGHTFTGMDIAGLGAMYRETGRTTDARRVLEDALTVWSDVSVSGKSPPPSIAFVLDELGRTMIRQRQYAEAEKVLRDALRSYDGRTLQTIALHVRPRAQVSSALGVALAGQGKFAEAEPLVLEAYEELNASRATLAGDARGILRDALGAVITVYRGAGKTDQLSKWNAKLGELTAAQR
jgi:eukaryotic-like serine/threonine-protein kinase